MDLFMSALLGFSGGADTDSSANVGTNANNNVIDLSKLNVSSESPSNGFFLFIKKYWYVFLIIIVIIIIIIIILSVKKSSTNKTTTPATTTTTTTTTTTSSNDTVSTNPFVFATSAVSSNIDTTNNASNTLIYQESTVNDKNQNSFTSIKDGVVSNTPTPEDLAAIEKAKKDAQDAQDNANKLIQQTQVLNANLFT
jgi:FtsZ-interacting cell division protein ZipA